MRRFPFVLFAVALASACNGATEPGPGASEYTSLPADQVLVGVEHITTVEGVRRANMKSDTTLVFDDSASVHLRGVDLELYNENGTLQATLTSESGELDRNTNRMVARGKVVLVVQGPRGRTITTEELHYDPQSKRIWSDVAVRSRLPNGEVTEGDGFTSDDKFQNFEIRRPRGSVRFEF